MSFKLTQNLIVMHAMIINIIFLRHAIIRPGRKQYAMTMMRRLDGPYSLPLHLEHVRSIGRRPALETVDDAEDGIIFGCHEEMASGFMVGEGGDGGSAADYAAHLWAGLGAEVHPGGVVEACLLIAADADYTEN